MKDYNITDYGIFSDAITSTNKYSETVNTAKETSTECETLLKDQSIFMGPIQEDCAQVFTTLNQEIGTIVENFGSLVSLLISTATAYQAGDKATDNTIQEGTDALATAGAQTTANPEALTTTVANQSTDKKNIDTTNVKTGTNVAGALTKYKDELDKAEYATVSENLFTTTTTETINGQPVQVTHVVINSGDQINGAPANGSYGSGLEKSSSAASRLGSSVLINGSHFDYSNGTEDLKGANNIVIVNGQIQKDGTSGGNELLLDNKGNIYNASGKSAQELVNNGVKYSFSCHSTQVIQNGDTSPSYREGNSYKRNVIGQASPGEYYIVTDTTYNNKLSDTAEYLKSKGCNNAYSLDQGGSVSLVRGNTLINNPSDENGERSVGDFLYFKA